MPRLARGLVLEVTGDDLVVLTPDGAFLRVRRPAVLGEAAVGAEVAFEWPAAQSTLPRATAGAWHRAAAAWLVAPGRRRWTAAVLAAAFIAALLPVAGDFWGSPRVYAHVSIDLPTGVSADLAVDAAGRVVSVRYLAAGSEGPPAERPVDLAGRDLDSAVAALLALGSEEGAAPRPSERGRGDANGGVPSEADGRPRLPSVITVAPLGPGGGSLPRGLAKKVAEADRKADEWARSRGAEAGVVRLALPAGASEAVAIRRAASEVGLSLGQYLLYLEAKKHGVAIDLAKAKHEGVARAIEEAGGSLTELLRAAQSETDYGAIFRGETGPPRGPSGEDQKPGHGGKPPKSKKHEGGGESGDARGVRSLSRAQGGHGRRGAGGADALTSLAAFGR